MFPEGMLGENETALWVRWYEEREQRQKKTK